MPQIRDTTEYRRVRDLPRRRLNERDAAAWAKTLTKELRLPGSTRELRPWQGMSLAEALGCKGAYLGLGVGHGKTDITWLLAVLFGARRALLVLPGKSLVEKTYHDFAILRKHWQAPPSPIRVITQQSLAPESGADFLTKFDPDLVMLDEADDFANAGSSACSRLDRFKVANEDVPYVCLTGSPVRNTIMAYHHLLGWCLLDRMPMPRSEHEAREWAQVIDAKKGRFPSRMGPGVLGATREEARVWFHKRLVETPGVMLVDGDSCDQPLQIRVRLAREDKVLDEAFKLFGKKQETPCGRSVSDPLSRWRIDGQYGCGVYKRWNPLPPDEWRDAYRAKNKFVRETIARSKHSHRPLDTEAQVFRRHKEHPVIMQWRAVRDMFDEEESSEVIWLTDSTIQSARDWLSESSLPGVIWTGLVEFGEALATATRLPYYGPEGLNQYGSGLHVADPKRSLVASWHANKRGFNLQAWKRQLIVMPPQSAKYLEQIFGRSHRQGQDAPVTVDVLATSGGTLDALEAAIREASFAKGNVGMTQKILRAKVEWAAPRITSSNKYRWARKAGAGRAHADAF